VGSERLDEGDYSGPGGARRVLRDRRVEAGVLETARGGLLRRGLALEASDVALVTNVAEDHLGEFGVHDLEGLAECKMVVARAARHLVLNADDRLLERRGRRLAPAMTWFSLRPRGARAAGLETHLASGGSAALLEDGKLTLQEAGRRVAVADLSEVPVALGGAALHNVANGLAAMAVARRLGVPPPAIVEGLRGFESSPEVNPGRLNVFRIDGVKVVLDFAHNPHGVAALLAMAAALPAERRLVSIGQAGDRDDHAILELARATWKAGPDRILIKAMNEYRRGRGEGEVAAMLEAELHRLGATDGHLERVESEIEAARAALSWARPGDLVLLIVHSGREAVTRFLREAGSATA
jgi:UDP-N-acetylmuramyl tripeptide synthase